MNKSTCPVCHRHVLTYFRNGSYVKRLTYHDNKQGKACKAGGMTACDAKKTFKGEKKA